MTSSPSNGVGFPAVRSLVCGEVCKSCRHLPSLSSKQGFVFPVLFTQLVWNVSVNSRSSVEGNELFNTTLAAGAQHSTYPSHRPRKDTSQDTPLLSWNLLIGGWNCIFMPGIRKVKSRNISGLDEHFHVKSLPPWHQYWPLYLQYQLRSFSQRGYACRKCPTDEDADGVSGLGIKWWLQRQVAKMIRELQGRNYRRRLQELGMFLAKRLSSSQVSKAARGRE